MSSKGRDLKVFIFLLISSVINAALGYNQNIDRVSQDYAYRSANGYDVYQRSVDSTTECITPAPRSNSSGGAVVTQPSGGVAAPGGEGRIATDNTQSAPASKLQALVQHIYAAQARVQLEANEIKKAQAVAATAQKSLEDAANNVRVITAALQTAQQEVAAAAVRAQTAQLQLAAHDQLLFTARQKVDALSSQMVGLQAEDGIVAPKTAVNTQALLAQLNEPLAQNQTPTPIPAIDDSGKGGEARSSGTITGDSKGLLNYGYFDYYG